MYIYTLLLLTVFLNVFDLQLILVTLKFHLVIQLDYKWKPDVVSKCNNIHKSLPTRIL